MQPRRPSPQPAPAARSPDPQRKNSGVIIRRSLVHERDHRTGTTEKTGQAAQRRPGVENRRGQRKPGARRPGPPAPPVHHPGQGDGGRPGCVRCGPVARRGRRGGCVEEVVRVAGNPDSVLIIEHPARVPALSPVFARDDSPDTVWQIRNRFLHPFLERELQRALKDTPPGFLVSREPKDRCMPDCAGPPVY